MKKAIAGAQIITLVCITSLLAGGEDMLAAGQKAPDFEMTSSSGDTVRLSDFASRNYVVLFFYPGDETPGCTKQLCAVRDDYTAFSERNARIFGVNPADKESHLKFVNRYSFQFPLLIDDGGKIAKKYGCGGMVVKRTVYVIDPHGIIIYAKRGLPPNQEILKAIPE